jgi:hypothetical protein
VDGWLSGGLVPVAVGWHLLNFNGSTTRVVARFMELYVEFARQPPGLLLRGKEKEFLDKMAIAWYFFYWIF